MDSSEDFSAMMLACVNMASSLGSPVIAQFVGIANPVLGLIFRRAFSHFKKDDSTMIECARLGISYSAAAETINDFIARNAAPRDDGFLDDIKGYPYAPVDELIEAAIRNAISDPETEKSVLYGKFIGTIPFRHDISPSRLVLLNDIITKLTIVDIKVLKEFYPGTPIDLTSLGVSVREEWDESVYERYIRLMKLQRLGLIVRQKPFRSDLVLQNEKISPIGAEVLRFLGSPHKE